MFSRRYEVREISPTRVLVENRSYWRGIGMEGISKIVEELTSSGRDVISAIPFNNLRYGGRNFLILLRPEQKEE